MTEKITPMMAQYRAVKEKYKDCMVLFRLGDFYEMFFEDAVVGSKILGIALTARNKGDGLKAPMCGVPYHAVENYIAKLTRAGKKVALCDQMTQPNGKDIVKRDVVRVITPGTTFNDDILDKKNNNYIASVVQSFDGFGFAYSDVTTGEFFVTRFESLDEVFAEIARINPSEIINPENLSLDTNWKANINRAVFFNYEIATEPEKILTDAFGVKAIPVFGIEDKKSCIYASGFLYSYLKDTQKTELKHIENIKFYDVSDSMILSESTIRNLDIFAKNNGLFSVLDSTRTPMGGRRLRYFMTHPLKSKRLIDERLEAVSKLVANRFELDLIIEVLGKFFDIERLLGRLTLGTANARDLVAIKESLKLVPELKKIISNPDLGCDFFQEAVSEMVDVSNVTSLIESAIKNDPAFGIHEGGIIKESFSEELDSLRAISTEGKSFIADMQKREIERTGISSLKIKYNQVFGYYIEISKSNLSNVPNDYMRKQTLVNAERFITPELKEYEEKVLTSMEKICELEYKIFMDVRAFVVENIHSIKRISYAVSIVDVICGFADIAVRKRYCKPEIFDDNSLLIDIKSGRHPIVESLSLNLDFVPNDCFIDPDVNVLNLITGPNMGGKSVYLKQVALIVYMAHIGSYVPAEKCSLGLVDMIFTRIGAADSISKGESTFMVEMIEAAQILNGATARSLVVLDEIGRGTSTYDGLSIAWAICEHIHDFVKAKTLFATHYHELISLVEKLPRGRNFSVAVRNDRDNSKGLVFLYKIVEGGTSRSYGIEVADLAGLPRAVVEKSREVLKKLESENISSMRNFNENQINIFENPESPVLTELRDLDPNNLTPMQALKKIHELKEKGLI